MSNHTDINGDAVELTYRESLDADESLDLRDAAMRESKRSERFECGSLELAIELLREEILERRQKIQMLEEEQRRDGVDLAKLIGHEHNAIDRIRRAVLPELEADLKINRRACSDSNRVSEQLFEESAAIRVRLGLSLVPEEQSALKRIKARRARLGNSLIGRTIAALVCPKLS